METTEKNFKLLLIGNQAVGKTSLLNRYVSNSFEVSLMGTAGLDLKKKIVTIDGQAIKIFIYDSAGHERFTKIALNQTKTADGILIVYDITDNSSFESVDSWVNSIKSDIERGIEVLLIGNKIDLVNNRVISTEEGEILAKKYNIPFIETSAKESINVENAFANIINNLYRKDLIKKNGKTNSNNNINHNNKKSKDSSCCVII